MLGSGVWKVVGVIPLFLVPPPSPIGSGFLYYVYSFLVELLLPHCCPQHNIA